MELRIFRAQGEGAEARYPVELRVNGEQEFPRGYLTPAPGFTPWRAEEGPGSDGERLYRWLFADPPLSDA